MYEKVGCIYGQIVERVMDATNEFKNLKLEAHYLAGYLGRVASVLYDHLLIIRPLHPCFPRLFINNSSALRQRSINLPVVHRRAALLFVRSNHLHEQYFRLASLPSSL